jgi:hypothetical protein
MQRDAPTLLTGLCLPYDEHLMADGCQPPIMDMERLARRKRLSPM